MHFRSKLLLTVAAVVTALALSAPAHAAVPTKAQTITVPKLVGKTVSAARSAVKSKGFVLKAADASSKKRTILLSFNWTITSQSPKPGKKMHSGATITVKALKTSEVPNTPEPSSSLPAAAPTAEPQTSTGLTETYAMSACDNYGKQQFPYGYDPHWILGRLAHQIENDQWYFKVETTVTNAYNAKRTVDVECYVVGTNTAPTVTQFLAY